MFQSLPSGSLPLLAVSDPPPQLITRYHLLSVISVLSAAPLGALTDSLTTLWGDILRYGVYMSKEQVDDLVAPPPDTLEVVNSWLGHHGILSSSVSRTHGGGWLKTTNPHRGEQDRDYSPHGWLCAPRGAICLRASCRADGALQFPAHASAGAAQAPQMRSFGNGECDFRRARESAIESIRRSCAGCTGRPPMCLSRRTRMRLGSWTTIIHTRERPDPTEFTNEFRDRVEAATFEVEQVNGGGQDPSHPGDEPTSSTSQAMDVSDPTIFYSSGWPFGDVKKMSQLRATGFLEWLNYILKQKKIPQTINVPYGNEELGLSQEYATTFVLFLSGDHGVGSGDCKDESRKVQFRLLFPGSYRRDRAVTTFLQNLSSKYSDLTTPGIAAGPDIAAQELDYLVCWNGSPYAVSRTSCATPVSQAKPSQAKPSPRSASSAPSFKDLAGLNDTTSGSNPGCNTDGFSAIAGWDPVSSHETRVPFIA
ncbi:hypothetical protein BJY52DRAFT_1228377 [Lactarius psammicola]|nr:hypothetical protein BJY52DRAFT_1228377 [Lactarius psammicola]